ncbi:MAG TPA: hypothetical protein PLH65_02175 [bacterium]|nr:hypothetical protein [bacterium]
MKPNSIIENKMENKMEIDTTLTIPVNQPLSPAGCAPAPQISRTPMDISIDDYCQQQIPAIIKKISQYLPPADYNPETGFFDYQLIEKKYQKRKNILVDRIEQLKLDHIAQECNYNIVSNEIIPMMTMEADDRINQITSNLAKLKSDRNQYQQEILLEKINKTESEKLEEKISTKKDIIKILEDKNNAIKREIRKHDLPTDTQVKNIIRLGRLNVLFNIFTKTLHQEKIQTPEELENQKQIFKKTIEINEVQINELNKELEQLIKEKKRVKISKSEKNKIKKNKKNKQKTSAELLEAIDRDIQQLEFGLDFWQTKLKYIAQIDRKYQDRVNKIESQLVTDSDELDTITSLDEDLLIFKNALHNLWSEHIQPILAAIEYEDGDFMSNFSFKNDDQILQNPDFQKYQANLPSSINQKIKDNKQRRKDYKKIQFVPNKHIELILATNDLINKISYANLLIISYSQKQSINSVNLTAITELNNKLETLYISNINYYNRYIADKKIKANYQELFFRGIFSEMYQIFRWQKENSKFSHPSGLAFIKSPKLLDKHMKADTFVCVFDNKDDQIIDISKTPIKKIFPLQLTTMVKIGNNNKFTNKYLDKRDKAWNCGVPMIEIDDYENIKKLVLNNTNKTSKIFIKELIAALQEQNREIGDYQNGVHFSNGKVNGNHIEPNDERLKNIRDQICALTEVLNDVYANCH